MTAAVNTAPGLASRLVNRVLAIKPLANLAKHQARQMMIERAEKIGVPWTKEVQALREAKLSPLGESHGWEAPLAQVQNPQLTYPDYYLRSFHAYEEGNLNWEAAFENYGHESQVPGICQNATLHLDLAQKYRTVSG